MQDESTLQGNCRAMMANKTLRSLENLQPLYMLPTDPLSEEVLIPGFRIADKVDCMVGFFSSEVLASLAPGLATYIAHSENSFRLIISPLLRAEDQDAIEAGMMSAEGIASEILEQAIITENLLQKHTLKCLAWLLRQRRMCIKIALMKDALFHPKVWLFEKNEDIIAVHGSSNVTNAGIQKNIEQVALARSWQDLNQRYIIKRFRIEFDLLWDNKNDSCLVVELPEAVKQNLLQTYDSKFPPTEDDLKALYDRAKNFSENLDSYQPPKIPKKKFSIPDWLEYENGPFAHQGKAVTAWCEADYRGILEMATGSGKTISSMIAAYRLHEIHKPLLIVIAAPYKPLIEQWCDEITSFGLNPVNLTASGGVEKRAKELQKLKRKLQTSLSDTEAIVVSHDALCSLDFQNAVKKFNCARLLVADEVHNLGRLSFVNNPPEFFEYRLGLSATPTRQYDEDGTQSLLGFFGPIVFQFALEEAIGRCLVEYDYHVHPVHLTEEEMDEWHDLTNKIKQNVWRIKGEDSNQPDNYLSKLLRDRRALLETASGKIPALEKLLDAEDNLRHTLIYTSDKNPNQLNGVNHLLHSKSLQFHRLTEHETANRKLMRRIITSFQDGHLHILTAKRVLDEGVNIPQICKAFILASTTVERQWVQRRGRLLRTCKEIGKTHSVIHDLIALPPKMEGNFDSDARRLIRSELHRVQEFAKLARNAGRPDGPLKIIDKMIDSAYL